MQPWRVLALVAHELEAAVGSAGSARSLVVFCGIPVTDQ